MLDAFDEWRKTSGDCRKRRWLGWDSLGTTPSRLKVGCMRGISVLALVSSEKGT